MLKMMKLTALLLLALVSYVAAEDCCLCDECEPLAADRDTADLIFTVKDGKEVIFTCEELVWDLLSTSSKGDERCDMHQTHHRQLCCPAVAEGVPDEPVQSHRSLVNWGTTSWNGGWAAGGGNTNNNNSGGGGVCTLFRNGGNPRNGQQGCVVSHYSYSFTGTLLCCLSLPFL